MIERQKFYVRAISAAMVHFILEVDVHLVFQTSLNWKANIRQKPSVLLHSVLSKYLGAEMFEQPFRKMASFFLGKLKDTHKKWLWRQNEMIHSPCWHLLWSLMTLHNILWLFLSQPFVRPWFILQTNLSTYLCVCLQICLARHEKKHEKNIPDPWAKKHRDISHETPQPLHLLLLIEQNDSSPSNNHISPVKTYVIGIRIDI